MTGHRQAEPKGSSVTVARGTDGESLSSVFARQAERVPDAIAVVCEGATLTYRQLDDGATALARRIIEACDGHPTAVGVTIEPSVSLIVGILAVVRAGAAYVPVPPDTPATRARAIYADASVDAVIGSESTTPLLSYVDCAVLSCDDPGRPAGCRQAQLPVVSGHDAAYIMYTSGSTGPPKGVVVEHMNVLRLFEATGGWFDYAAPNVWSMCHSCAFDFSVWELWGALLHGGRLVVVPYWTVRSAAELLRLLSAEQVTILSQTPTAFGELVRADAESGGRLPLALRTVVLGGESVNFPHLLEWMRRRGTVPPAPELVNMYGITEATVHCTYRLLSLADCLDGRNRIGVPLSDLDIHLLDDSGAEVAAGSIGEFYIAGPGVARGYLNRDDLTRAAFSLRATSDGGAQRVYRTGDFGRQLPDGTLEFVGRRDDQVKVRGHRVECGEVEFALGQHEAVEGVAVVAGPDTTGSTGLCAYIVPDRVSAPLAHRQLQLTQGGMLSGGITAELSSGLPVVAYRVAEIRFMEAELREQAELAPESLPCATDRVVVDVGANVGLFTLLARYRAPHAKVVAIEPVPELFSLLSANVALHGVDAACVRAAMGEDRGIRRFTFYPGLSLMSGFYADDASDRAMVTRFERQRTSTNPDQDDVVAMALDDAFRAPRRDACEVAALSHVFRDHALDRIDLLKVDVERAELEVLRGISPPDWKRVGRVVVEAESSVIEDVRDTLERQGLTVRCVRLPLLTQTGLALVIGTRGPSSLPEDGLTALAAPPYASPTAVETALRLFTAEHLPTYMVPSRFVLVPELPTLSSGKVDRSALRERHVRERGSAPGPRRKASGGMEQLFCDAWAATLGLASVGPDDDFFELGGHSLAAARVIAVVRAAGVDIPLRLLFDHPTPSGLASAVKREEPVRR